MISHFATPKPTFPPPMAVLEVFGAGCVPRMVFGGGRALPVNLGFSGPAPFGEALWGACGRRWGDTWGAVGQPATDRAARWEGRHLGGPHERKCDAGPSRTTNAEPSRTTNHRALSDHKPRPGSVICGRLGLEPRVPHTSPSGSAMCGIRGGVTAPFPTSRSRQAVPDPPFPTRRSRPAPPGPAPGPAPPGPSSTTSRRPTGTPRPTH
jgi:hypothetical protein